MKTIRRISVLIVIVACIALVTFAIRLSRPALPAPAAQVTGDSKIQPSLNASRRAPVPMPQSIQAYPDFQRHPFEVSLSRADCEWTSEDGRNTNVIRQLAHNDLEYARMLDENSRIFRRQLVYRKETAATLIERAKLTGENIHNITLPALDGQEVQFEINRADLNPSGLEGTFTGRLAGKADSMVTFAFKVNREAFTILSPSDGLYIQADPREPGEVVLKEIDPVKYVAGVCGNP